jgi:hypothetical protein
MLAKQTGLTRNQVNSYVTCILVWTRCSCFIQVRISELVKSPNQTKPIRIHDELSKFAADDACVVAVGVLGGSGGMDGSWQSAPRLWSSSRHIYNNIIYLYHGDILYLSLCIYIPY